MLGFFPTPYPDELLYSVLARYYVWSANVSPKTAVQELFGRRTVIATFDLPSHLDSLVQNLPLHSKHTAESLIQQNTLYPFYALFLPLDRAEAVLNSMQNHFSGDIHTRTGIMASTVPQVGFFRFCTICFQEDIKNYGEPYWHRVHQIAGILVCPIHKVFLQSSIVKTQGENRHEFYAADESNCLSTLHIVDYASSTFNNLVNLAQDVNLLLANTFPQRNGEWFRQRYQSSIIEKGLATASGRIYQKDFVREFVAFYGNEFLEFVHSKIEPESQCSWLSDIVRKHRKVFHPIRHLLLIRFLNQDLLAFFQTDSEKKSFGDGPWTCFNGASKHYLERVVASKTVSYSHEVKKLIGTFSCSCGFIYSTSDATVPYSDKLSFGKIKSFGKIWERNLKQLLAEKRVSLREAARQLKVDTRTVIRYAELLKLIDKKLAVKDSIEDDPSKLQDNKREDQRAVWLKATQDNPTLSKTLIRKLLPDVYIWLYRHDQKWLERNSPRRRDIKPQNKRVDWAKRDDEILVLSRQTIKNLSERLPPIRITVGSVSSKLNLRALLEKHLDKMPKTKSFLLSQTESVEQFQIRRIYWAAHELSARGNYIEAWRVMRFAGIKSSCSKTIKQAINNAVLEANSRLHSFRKTAS